MRRVVATIAAIVTVLSGVAAPARATTAKVITLTGVATVNGGLGYPGVGPPHIWPVGTPDLEKVPCTISLTPDVNCFTLKSGPKGEPMGNFQPEGNHASFFFNSIACLKASADNDAAKKTPGVASCAIDAAGALWGYCGLATGLGTMVIWNPGLLPFDKSPERISTDIKFTDIAGIWYLTGGNATTSVYGILAAQPMPGILFDPSCALKTADRFLLEGQLYYKNLT